jgi:CheY-like chemotaxis protein
VPKQIENKHPGEPGSYRIMLLATEHLEEMRAACHKGGHELVPIQTIRGAIDFINSRDHIDVVVSGVHLENESVFDLLREFKNKPGHQNLKIILICQPNSGMANRLDSSIQKAAELLGCDKYLFQPTFNPDELLAAIQEVLPAAEPKRIANPEGAY